MSAASYGGLLGSIAETSDIQRELGVSLERAWEIQRERSAERLREYELAQAEAQAEAESNVIPFRLKH